MLMCTHLLPKFHDATFIRCSNVLTNVVVCSPTNKWNWCNFGGIWVYINITRVLTPRIVLSPTSLDSMGRTTWSTFSRHKGVSLHFVTHQRPQFDVYFPDKGVAMRAIALPDDDSLSVIESSSPGSRKLLRYRVEYTDPEQFSSGYNSSICGGGGEYVPWHDHHTSPTSSHFSYFWLEWL